jgi:catechol 2,3-dioxygenase-like lactoylglutathione lyase family enzyme
MVSIRRLRHIGVNLPDTRDSVRFYEDIWGLRTVDDHNGAVYLRGKGREHHVLALYPAERRGINHISFALDSAAEVDAAMAGLTEQGVRILEQPRQSEEPGGGYGMRFVDPDGRVIELSAEVDELKPGEWSGGVNPQKVTHVVLNTPNIDGLCDFYTRVLGFRVSDWSEHQMVFLRCNPDHHSIAFNRESHASLNHVAYELGSMDEVMRGIGNVRKQGPRQMWGPGRHGPGNNVFAYFQDADGFVCEYTSDVQQIVDEASWKPQVWQRTPELMDRWGTAGFPPPEMRAAMAGEPDPGVVAANP